jgi:hypothetical protein
VNRCPRYNVVKFQRLVVGELLARMNELDLIDLNALLFLQRLFDRQYLILGFKIERLLASRKSLDENLQEDQIFQAFMPKRRNETSSEHRHQRKTKMCSETHELLPSCQ